MGYYGTLICRERLRRNWSQEGLCRGICAVSYLSKIEKGRAEPSPQILQMLLQRLELRTDSRLEAEAAGLAEQGRELLFTGCVDDLVELLSGGVEAFRATASGLDLLLLEQLSCPKGQPLDAVLEASMAPGQLALQRILQNREEEAIPLLPNAYTYTIAGQVAYGKGSYAAAAGWLQTGYDLAAREGAPRLMLLCRLYLGNSCCNRLDVPNMLQHYAVARRLALALGDREVLEDIAYNTASVNIETGHYEEAYTYFSSLEAPSLMALHKLAICCEKTGRREAALAALDRADTMESLQPDTALARKMCALVRFRLEQPAYLADDAYGSLLMECFEACRRQLPMGYASFHLPWVLEWLTASRQYKRAYELLLNFPENHI